MSNETKTKVCWSCEGRLSDSETRCLYCGADQKILAPTQEEYGHSPYKLVSPQATEKPIPIPVYKPKDSEVSLKDPLKEQMESITSAPKKKEEPVEEESPQIQEAVKNLQVEEKPKTEHEKQKGQVAALIFSMGGSTFFLFALALSLFSKDGQLTISWNSHWWPLYMLASLPMLFFSWRLSRKFED